eukprot:6203110-Pleurochrysis_carterae.AAC.8
MAYSLWASAYGRVRVSSVDEGVSSTALDPSLQRVSRVRAALPRNASKTPIDAIQLKDLISPCKSAEAQKVAPYELVLEPVGALALAARVLVRLDLRVQRACRETAVREPRRQLGRALRADRALALRHRVGRAHVLAREPVPPPDVLLHPAQRRLLASDPCHGSSLVHAAGCLPVYA